MTLGEWAENDLTKASEAMAAKLMADHPGLCTDVKLLEVAFCYGARWCQDRYVTAFALATSPAGGVG